MICLWTTKILNIGAPPGAVTLTVILMAIASMPTSNEGTTEFPAHFVLLKRKHKTCVR